CKMYPGDNQGIVSIDSSCTTVNGTTILLTNYISQIPMDPRGYGYDYSIKIGAVDYVLHASLEGYNEVIRDGLSSWDSTDFRIYSSTGYGSPTFSASSCGNSVGLTDYCVGPR
ncbi:MAG: hypothetical protein AAB777_01205, partial [Patescibacteria group bacterium]